MTGTSGSPVPASASVLAGPRPDRSGSGLNRLAESDVAGYFEANADAPGAIWLFQHIPKTAGSSFRAELARRLLPEANIAVDYGDDTRPHNVKLREAVEAFRAAAQRRPVRFASGHLPRPMIEQIRSAQPEVRLLTMLRDPVARVVSEFRYQRTPQHPPYRAFIERFPRFEDYLTAPESQNKMMEFLRRSPADSVADVIADLERSYSFIGVTECYELSCRILFRLLGEDALPSVYERRTLKQPNNQIPGLEDRVPRIRELNALDQQVYDHFRGLLERQRPVIERFLNGSVA